MKTVTYRGIHAEIEATDESHMGEPALRFFSCRTDGHEITYRLSELSWRVGCLRAAWCAYRGHYIEHGSAYRVVWGTKCGPVELFVRIYRTVREWMLVGGIRTAFAMWVLCRRFVKGGRK
ncbi:MAG: hypothetical protein IMZ62_12705 [Chloroflexi bacterium]|nr:hypothetical protein [Chloroflexota bacterium]